MEGSATDIDKVGSSSKHMPLVRVYSGSSVSQTSVDNEEEPSAGSLAVQIVPTDPVVVTKANKIICATAFILIIVSWFVCTFIKDWAIEGLGVCLTSTCT